MTAPHPKRAAADPGIPPEVSTAGTFRRLVDLALPVVGLNLLGVMALAIDTIMCGHLDNADDVLTALGFATQIIFLLMIIMIGLTIGSVALVARAYGAGDNERVNHVFGQSVTLTAAVSLVVAIVGNLIGGDILGALGASPDIVEIGLDYLRPLLTGTFLFYLTVLYGAVLRGVGNTRLPFMAAIAATGINILANYGLILGNWGLPRLGVQGAAIGTLLSQFGNVLIMVVAIRRGAIPGLRARLLPARLDRQLARILFRIGAPAALDMLVLNVGFLAMVAVIGRIDELAIAAHGVGIRIQGLAFVPGLGIAQATGALVGQALGAGDPDRARATARAAVMLCAAVMSALGLAVIAGAHPLVALFNIEPGTALESYSVQWMIILGFCMPPVGVQIAFGGMLQGAGATDTSLRINAVGTFMVHVPIALLLAFPLDLAVLGVWLSFPIALVVKALLAWRAYREGSWAKVGTNVK